MCRCDTDRSQFITSTIDPRDHEYIIGATKDIEPLVVAVAKGMAEGSSYMQARDEWKTRSGLMTYDEAVKEKATDQQYQDYSSKATAFGTSLNERRRIAKAILGEDIFFDWDLPRSKEGQYMWRPSVKTIVERAILAAPFGDMTWARMDAPGETQYEMMHDERLTRNSVEGHCRVSHRGPQGVPKPAVCIRLHWNVRLRKSRIQSRAGPLIQR